MPPEETIDVTTESSPEPGVDSASLTEQLSPEDLAIEKGDYAAYERIANARDIGRAEEPAARVSGKPAPASQPEKTTEPQSQSRPPKPKTAHDRIQELLAQNAVLKRQLEGKPAETGVTQTSPPAQSTPAPAPAATPVPKPAAAEPIGATDPKDPEPILDHKPDGSRWKDYDDYRDTWKAWAFREGGRRDRAETLATQQKQAEERVRAEWNQRLEVVKKDPNYPDYATVAFNGNVKVNETTVGYLYTSPHGPKILYHLGKNPEVAARLLQLNPYDTARFLRDFEVAAFEEKPKPAKTEPPPTKRTTRMPPPATDLGARNSGPPDEIQAAVDRNDFRTFERLQNEADIRAARISR